MVVLLVVLKGYLLEYLLEYLLYSIQTGNLWKYLLESCIGESLIFYPKGQPMGVYPKGQPMEGLFVESLHVGRY